MEVQYKDHKLEKLCTSEREMQRKRPDLQKKLRLRVKALYVAATLGDLPTTDPGGRWHGLTGDSNGVWAGELSGNWRILVEPSPPKSLSAAEVTVTDIKDYH